MRRPDTAHDQSGLALLEVVAGLVIMASLVAALLLAHARHARQWRAARAQREAAEAADALLSNWWLDRANLPREHTGTLGDTLRWRTTVVSNDAARELGAAIVRLEVSDVRGDDALPPLIVELVMPATDASSPVPGEARP